MSAWPSGSMHRHGLILGGLCLGLGLQKRIQFSVSNIEACMSEAECARANRPPTFERVVRFAGVLLADLGANGLPFLAAASLSLGSPCLACIDDNFRCMHCCIYKCEDNRSRMRQQKNTFLPAGATSQSGSALLAFGEAASNS